MATRMMTNPMTTRAKRPAQAGLAWLAFACSLAAVPAFSQPKPSDWSLRAGQVPTVEGASKSDAATVAGPVARSAHLAQTGDLTRLVFDLSGPIEAHAFVLADPRRVIVDLQEVNFQIDPDSGRAAAVPKGRGGKPSAPKPLAGVISSYRFGLFAPGKSRIVVDLAETARIVRAESETGPEGNSRFVLDLAKVDAATFASAAAEGAKLAAAAPGPRSADAERGDATLPLVVLDPGHGGIDIGARGAAGALEKQIVFEFAKSLADRLKDGGHYRVTLTRNEDIFVPLGERVQIARAAGAALFVSVHADTLSDAASVSGATVYTVSDKASDAEAARVAEKENMADIVGGLDGKEDASDVNDILFDLTRRETRAYSHVFARTLIGYLKERTKLNKNPQRSAGFKVLKAPDVPSVLLELGYLSSEHDLNQLRSAEWREQASLSVARAIDAFFAQRAPAAPERAAVTNDSKDIAAAVAPAIH